MSGNSMDRGITINKPSRVDELLGIIITVDGKGVKAKKTALLELVGMWGTDQDGFYKLPKQIEDFKR